MEQEKIDRINYLARKSRETVLSPEEKLDQEALRTEYRKSIICSLEAQLDNTFILQPDGSKKKVCKTEVKENGK